MVFRQGQLKGQVYNIEHPTSCFYNLTKPLTRQDLLPYQVYVPWSWEAKPTRIAAADGVEQPRSCKEAKDFDEIPTFSAVYDHSCNPDSTFLLVAMYKSICVCGCQWGVYASTWPIKKKKNECFFKTQPGPTFQHLDQPYIMNIFNTFHQIFFNKNFLGHIGTFLRIFRASIQSTFIRDFYVWPCLMFMPL